MTRLRMVVTTTTHTRPLTCPGCYRIESMVTSKDLEAMAQGRGEKKDRHCYRCSHIYVTGMWGEFFKVLKFNTKESKHLIFIYIIFSHLSITEILKAYLFVIFHI